jgi:hypothetical protein
VPFLWKYNSSIDFKPFSFFVSLKQSFKSIAWENMGRKKVLYRICFPVEDHRTNREEKEKGMSEPWQCVNGASEHPRNWTEPNLTGQFPDDHS